MTAMSVTTPDRKLTRADWAAMPESNRKIELLDGVVVEMASPTLAHQDMLQNLNQMVFAARPAGWKVIFAPFDMYVADTIVLQPDLLVAPSDRFQQHGLEEAPTLAVEILSPSTRNRDLVKKFNWFAGFGIEYVWFADPAEPSVLALELVEGHYVEVAEAVGDQTITLERPFAIELNPQRLIEE